MIKVGIYGGSGYTGEELLRLLAGHPGAKVVAATSRRFAGVPVAEVYPVFSGLTDLIYTDTSPEAVADLVDIVFLALPHGVSMEFAPVFLKAGRKVIDLSADFRIHAAATYEAWYGRHTTPGMLGEAVYGLPEVHRANIRNARLVANPGCYPTSIILGLAPVLKSRWIDADSVIADSKSGVSGAGRDPQIPSLFCEVAGGFKAYKVGVHRHTPEIEQELSALAEREMKISFTPHLLPVKRGILSTIYAKLSKDVTAEEATALYQTFYREESFVRICPSGQFPNLSSVVGSNYCDIGVAIDQRTGRIIVVSAIDNLIKGASGQAIQNMNLMCGLKEETGLPAIALFP
ncbi:MAG: N-acetyl-gamma-glutamyl-phosphate reductase [Syntrophus sp. (in: bacteria)]|nr:N-acetyl-gamma-glutamyl-phosphate reductase [Syntrophus sp. (in: bacteria)]